MRARVSESTFNYTCQFLILSCIHYGRDHDNSCIDLNQIQRWITNENGKDNNVKSEYGQSSATCYMYEQGQDYPVTYIHYINYGNGRYYDTPLHYVVDGSIVGTTSPVAVSVPQTTGFYEKPVISYANAGQKPSLYVQQQFSYIKSGNDHVAGQGVYVVSRKPLALYYVPVSNEKLVVEV